MAGTCKPNIANLGPEVIPVSYSGIGPYGTLAAALFNSSTIKAVNSGYSYMYEWIGASYPLFLTIDKPVNIWRSPGQGYENYYAALVVYRKDNEFWVDITNSLSQVVTYLASNQWEKTLSNLPPGEYYFVSKGTRLDSEWYLELSAGLSIDSLQISKNVVNSIYDTIDLHADIIYVSNSPYSYQIQIDSAVYKDYAEIVGNVDVIIPGKAFANLLGVHTIKLLVKDSTNTIYEKTINITSENPQTIIKMLDASHVYEGQHKGALVYIECKDYGGNDLAFKIEHTSKGCITDFDSVSPKLIPVDSLDYGVNSLTVISSIGSASISFNITKESPHRLTAQRTLTSIDGGFIKNNIDLSTNVAKFRNSFTGKTTNSNTNEYSISIDKYTNKLVVN